MKIRIWNGRNGRITAWQKVQTICLFLYVHCIHAHPMSTLSIATLELEFHKASIVFVYILEQFHSLQVRFAATYTLHSVLYSSIFYVWVALIWSFVIHSFAFIFRWKSNSIQFNSNEKTFNTYIKWNRKMSSNVLHWISSTQSHTWNIKLISIDGIDQNTLQLNSMCKIMSIQCKRKQLKWNVQISLWFPVSITRC